MTARPHAARPRAVRPLAAIRVAVAAVLLATIVVQVVDLSIGGGLVPDRYFLFFTIDSSLLEVAALGAAGIAGLAGVRSRAVDTAALAVVPYGLVTGVVYNAVLRGLPTHGYQGMDWENEVVHVVVPAFLLLDWFVLRALAGDRMPLRGSAVGVTAVFPLAWLAVTMIRGAATGYYPYPFLEPGGPGGVGSVLVWVLVLTAVILLVAALGVAVTRRSARTTKPAGSGLPAG